MTPERVRDVRFAEQWRGYRTDEVDDFVEQVADAFDQLERRLAEAAERSAQAERRLEERGADDDLRRTLVLAQRTADAARQEAQEEASRLVAEAEAQAAEVLRELEERKAGLEAEIDRRIEAELAEVTAQREALEADVELLASYVERHRARLADELRTHLRWLERPGHLDDLPAMLGPPSPTPAGAGPVPARRPPTDDQQGAPSPAAHEDGSGSSTSSSQASAPPAATPLGVGDPRSSRAVEAAPVRRAPVPPAGRGGSIDPAGTRPVSPPGAGDDTVLDDFGVIPWGGEAPEDDTDDDLFASRQDDDPFIAELRRAVNDPEPLGPRDDPGDGDDGTGDIGGDLAFPPRSRRRHS
ncbi:MAG TPA: DivIVA domain-containing protein [Acidimicrobiales bacterium]|nr:DivIVA domain-containing protein [Acidimicrobiales bacterium]